MSRCYSPGCRARDRFQQRAFASAFAHGCLRLAAAIGRRTIRGATATAGPVSQTGVTKTRARSKAADTLVPRPDGRQAVVAHQLENDDLLERLSSDPVLHLVAPSMEVRAAYRRPIRRAITGPLGKVTADLSSDIEVLAAQFHRELGEAERQLGAAPTPRRMPQKKAPGPGRPRSGAKAARRS